MITLIRNRSNITPPCTSTMIKANELGVVLTIQFEDEVNQTESCSCCGSITANPLINPRVVVESDRLAVAFICPNCEDETNDIKRVSLIDADLIDPTLLAAYKWLDSKLLQRHGWKLYIRRPTFAERQDALRTGVILPAGAAVVVAKHGDSHFSRRLMPMPFPWRDDNEWIAGPIAAQDALDLADAIGRGEVDMLEVGGNIMFFSSSETLGSVEAGS
jgi:hypothetical protein